MSDERPTCQLCGGPIEGEVYRWNDGKVCPCTAAQHSARATALSSAWPGFLNRNAAYLNGQGEPVLLEEAV